MSPRKLFEQELEELRQDVLQMAEWVQDGYDCLFAALEKKDGDQMRRYVRHDRTIEDMQRNIESQCLSLLTRQTPVARDLRTVSAALKVVTDLERIGDHAVDIAELALRLDQRDAQSMIQFLPEMVANVKAMLQGAIRAFVRKDLELARSMEERDDIIDGLFNRVKQEAVKLLKEDAAEPDKVVDLLMIAKYLERIGDHAVNVCEWTEFFDTGLVKNVRIL